MVGVKNTQTSQHSERLQFWTSLSKKANWVESQAKDFTNTAKNKSIIELFWFNFNLFIIQLIKTTIFYYQNNLLDSIRLIIKIKIIFKTYLIQLRFWFNTIRITIF